jgi:hypothetical protein
MDSPTWKRLDDGVGQNQEVERQVVYVESFVIELHALLSAPPAFTLLAFPGTGTGTGTFTGAQFEDRP